MYLMSSVNVATGESSSFWGFLLRVYFNYISLKIVGLFSVYTLFDLFDLLSLSSLCC